MSERFPGPRYYVGYSPGPVPLLFAPDELTAPPITAPDFPARDPIIMPKVVEPIKPRHLGDPGRRHAEATRC
jgi:hypothetical protein